MRGRRAVRTWGHGRGKPMVDIRRGSKQPKEGVAREVLSVNFEPHCSSSLPEPSNEATVIISSPSTTTIDMELALYNTMGKCVRRSAKSAHHYRWAHHYPIGDGIIQSTAAFFLRKHKVLLFEMCITTAACRVEVKLPWQNATIALKLTSRGSSALLGPSHEDPVAEEVLSKFAKQAVEKFLGNPSYLKENMPRKALILFWVVVCFPFLHSTQ
ncbi:hypothetical protein BDZ91DRAFT_764217 [Kalaharituber pfeilii]|nr:hypothetical protein BDZ91DRAFT_764217 [Kalaharituber pfeilii]